MQTKITYFDVRGRAEPVRLMFEDLAIPYEDERISLEQWPKRKSEFKFGQLPVLEHNGNTIEESGAIFNFLARTHGLEPSNESALIVYDQVNSMLLTSSYELGLSFWNPDFEKIKDEMLEKKLPMRLQNLETLYREKACKPYWVDDKPMHCDYQTWHYLDMVRLFHEPAIHDFPGLAEFKRTFEARPRINAYLKSSRRPKRYTIEMATFGGHVDDWVPA